MPSLAESISLISGDRPDHLTLQEQVYQRIRLDIMTGKFIPGKSVTIRGLAETLGTSPMPVREALRRLVAERALQLLPNRRVSVPAMTIEKYSELTAARVALEPLAAERALPHMDDAMVAKLTRLDAEVDEGIRLGDVELYLSKNLEFHFTMYRCGESQVIMPMIESLWLQMVPFLYLAMKRKGLGAIVDQHQEALSAIRNRDAAALAQSIRLDILDGVNRMPESEFVEES
ncbi:GntR family transcriptional regulator [Aestuariispira insulae]|uniref:GntR family transcriptional regulator n=1 Tax=Aestuariispira insulae TaxID=1461337 RepID=A0A3D9HVU3_9PROT|nr:GntR family transcriptional regulator [Aestuariispira insulae]RED53633.1 GntR family transcriptional regulator [Aestuariispira insulae]